MQVHAPPRARGAAPPALPCFVLGPWHQLAPAAGEGASSPKCVSGAPSPLPGLPRGMGVRGRPEAAQAALPGCCAALHSALPASAARSWRQLIAVVSSRGCES
ncbi:hypothetical protein NN561_020314 [Cricetulus griseus]